MQAQWHHVGISVADLDRALHFYRDLLGFEVEWDHPQRGGEEMSKVVGLNDVKAHMVMLRGYGTRIELFDYLSPKGQAVGSGRQCDYGLIHFALTVTGLQELYDRLVKTGVEFNCPPQVLRHGVLATYMKDPEGVTIELVEYNEGA